MVKGTVYKQVFERKRQPDEGAQSYAYETLDLPQFTFIGPCVSVLQPDPVPLTVAPLYAYQAGTVQGMPLSAGGLYSQPLVDQNGVPVGAMANEAIPDNIYPGQPNPLHYNSAFDYPSPGVLDSSMPNNPFPI